MAIHKDVQSLLRESVREYLHTAEYCVSYRKDNRWGLQQVGGCLGFPAAAMLFSIVDTIGSFHRQDGKFTVSVDGKKVSIRKDGFQHFFVLNSPYYNQSLGERDLRKLYENFRSLLVHNASMAPGNYIFMGSGDNPFPIDSGRQFVDVNAFLDVSRKAVNRFLQDLELVVPGSKQEAIIWKKR